MCLRALDLALLTQSLQCSHCRELGTTAVEALKKADWTYIETSLGVVRARSTSIAPFPASKAASLSGQLVHSIGADCHNGGSLVLLGPWISVVPYRVGSCPTVDIAVKALLAGHAAGVLPCPETTLTSQKAYGDALVAVQAAVGDPKVSTSDHTTCAVALLVAFEVRLCCPINPRSRLFSSVSENVVILVLTIYSWRCKTTSKVSPLTVKASVQWYWAGLALCQSQK